MNKGRRIAALAATATAFLGLTSAVPASAATAAKGPRPVSQLLDTVADGEGQFVSVRFTTDKKVCDFKLKVKGNAQVAVSYPAGRSYTSLAQDAKLKVGEVDYAAFKVTADVHHAGSQILAATVSYDFCGAHDAKIVKNTGFLLPVTMS